MALRTHPVPIQFRAGIDTKSDPRTAPQGSLLEVENMYYQRTGELRVRNGYTPLTNSPAISSLDNLFVTPGGALMCIPKTWAGSSFPRSPVKYSTALAVWERATLTGGGDFQFPACAAKISGVDARPNFSLGANATGDLVEPDTGSTASVALTTYVDTGVTASFIWELTDTNNGVVIAQGFVSIATSRQPVVAAQAVGSLLCMIYPDTAGTPSLTAKVINSTGTVAGTYTLALNAVSAAQPWIDARPIPGSGNVIVAYRATAGGVSTLIFNPATGAVVTGPVNIAAADATMTLGLLDDSLATGNFYVATAGSTAGVVVRTLSAALAVTATNIIYALATTGVRNVTGYINTSATNYTVAWDVDATPTYATQLLRGIWTGSASVQTVAICGIVSRAFRHGSDGRYYLIVSIDSSVQATYAMLSIDTNFGSIAAVSAAQIMSGYAGGRRRNACSVTSAWAAANGSQTVAIAKKQKLTTSASTVLTAVRSVCLCELSVSTSALRRPREAGGTLYFPGGIIMKDDGRALTWATSPFAEESITPSQVVGAGALTLLATYSYVFVLRRTDSNGNIIRSPQSVPMSVTLTGANNTVQFIPSAALLMSFPYDFETTILELYRAGPAAAGATGYNKVLETALVGGFPSFSDVASDATANTGEQLYTTGNVLENFVTPSCNLLEANSGRLWIVNAENPVELWYSKEIKQGYSAGFHPLNTLRLQGDGYGAITALAAMDGRLIAFKSTAIYAISGDGPNDLGQGSFNQPQAASLNVGTILPGSVVASPDGIMFQAASGIYLLSRGLAVTYLGKPVEQYTLAANVVDASLVRGTTQVRFVMANGRCLVWDYDKQEWTTFLLAVSGSTITACADAPTGWCYALANGTIMQETAGLNTDNGAAIGIRIVTSHLALAGLMGFKRIRAIQILGEFIGAHTLTAAMEYNMSGANAQTEAIAGSAPYQFEVPIGDGLQKSESVKLTLTASSSAGGFRLSGINVLVGLKPGQYRMPSSKRMT